MFTGLILGSDNVVDKEKIYGLLEKKAEISTKIIQLQFELDSLALQRKEVLDELAKEMK